MRFDHKKADRCLFALLLLVILALPIGIQRYEHLLWKGKIPPGTRTFTLTGHTEKGWLLGELQALDVIPMGLSKQPFEKPSIHVEKGDRVVLKLKSSDVVHGFSLKDFGIFITDGIHPGKTMLVTFVADKAGTFVFSCNAICGDNHKNMQGTLTVRA